MKRKIKNIFILFFTLIGKLCSYLFTITITNKIREINRIVYSSYLARSFKYFGNQSFFHGACTLLGTKHITIGHHTHIGKNGVLTAWEKYRNQHFCPEISIGNYTHIGDYCHISAINKIKIGDNVLTGRWLTIVDNSHGLTNKIEDIPPKDRVLISKGDIIIGDNVWIGDKVSIVSGVTIGRNSIVGANSLINKSVPENCIAGGNPARIIKQF